MPKMFWFKYECGRRGQVSSLWVRQPDLPPPPALGFVDGLGEWICFLQAMGCKGVGVRGFKGVLFDCGGDCVG